MATYYRWEKSHIEYAAASTEISGAVRESGNYDPSKSHCGYVWHSDSITVTADKITLNNPARTNLSANVYGTAVGGYCMCTPLSVTTAPSFDYVYKSSGGDEQTFFRGEHGFAQVQGSPYGNPSTLYKVTPSGATQGSFIEYIYSESPSALPPRRGQRELLVLGPDGHHRQPAVQHQRITRPAQGGQQCVRELGSGLFRRRGHLQL